MTLESRYIAVPILRDMHIVGPLIDMIGRDGFICGGFARYCCSPLPFPVVASDIDIYCYKEESFDVILKRFVAGGWEAGKETSASVSFTLKGFPKVQLIKPLQEGKIKFVGLPSEVLDNFDFTVARVAIVPEIGAIADEDFLEDEKAKRLVIKNIHCPVSEIYRIAKYVKKGYWIKIVELLKVFAEWEGRDQEYRDRLFGLATSEDPSKEDIEELERLLHVD